MKALLLPSLLLVTLALNPVLAQESPPPPPETPETPAETETETALNDTIFANAVRLDRAVSSTTGMAISPLLGMGVLGMWQYLKAENGDRAQLPWFTNPWVWGVALGLFGLGFLKDTFGMVVPEVLKKPLAALDVLENKASGLVVALAVIPASVATQLPAPAEPGAALGAGDGAPVLAVVPMVAPVLLAIPLMIVMFGAVWMVFHALRCLLLLSPSSIITGAILGLKGLFLAGFAVLASISPWLGVALSLVIVIFCIAISGWAFRWNVFGTLFAWDVLLSKFDEPLKDGEELRGFARPGLPDVKPRTYGSVRRDGEELVFRYQPWLIMPEREARFSLENRRLGVRKGLVFPAITARSPGRDSYASLVELRPRFRTHEELISANLQAEEILPSRVVQSAQNAVRWLRETIDSSLATPRTLPG